MDSKKMRECLSLPGAKPETNKDRTDIPFKAHQVALKDLPLHSRQQDDLIAQSKPEVGTLVRSNHNVGQLENNLYKVKRVLQKTQFVDNLSMTHLEEGDPSAILKIIHHLMFRASEKFTAHITNSVVAGVSSDVKYMPDGPFLKNAMLILCDLFGYRSELTPSQFFQTGFVERKLILLLDIYDILKQTRKNLKINSRLDAREAAVCHASDESIKEYQVINHKQQVARNMLFKINT
mmetsp:Transcript_15682/g.24051  ORF Transcript_15682/g.24051 Transcript_15682/m.24051 type:complete len:235 (+) Transcript_15682:1-705(+)